jgi:hypothetical protein
MTYDACYCDYDPPTFCTIKTVKGRKEHKCDECRGPIAVGEQHEYVSGKWDGDLQWFRTCPLCLELRQWALISVPCFCFGYSNLHQDVIDMVQEVAPGVPGFVFEWGRRMIKIDRHKTGLHWPRRAWHTRRQPSSENRVR